MKYRYAIIAYIAAFLLQGSVLNLASVFGVTPNLTLCLITGLTFMYENNYFNIGCAVVVGLLSDIFYGIHLGVTAMSYFLICLGVIVLRRNLNKECIDAAVIVMAIATVGFSLITWGLYSVCGENIAFVLVLKRLLPQILWNAAVIALFYKVVSGRVIKYRNDRYYV